MARFGTAFIDIQPSLDAFGAGLGKKIEAKLAGVTPDLKQHIEVDVDRDTLSRAGAALTKDAANIGSSIAGSFGQAFGNIATAAGSLLGVGPLFTALGSAAAAAAPLVLGLAVALGVLISSFAAAVAGATALGVALAGALGPVALVAVAAIAKVVQIIKAIHDDGKAAAGSTLAVANAQSQLQSATEGVANAQTNLKTQTAAAYRAWQDSIEAVKDDLLSVQDAQLGIADANLSLREAQQALKEFKKDAPGLQGLFKKFTDVNVDTSGLSKALADARKASGGKLSGDDSLKLERLILNVRRAKLQEKHATDGLHDANVNLQRDRQTEAGFLKKGIAAYPGYTSATQGLATANRQLAAAQRASAAAVTKQQGALAKLSPLERKLATTFGLISDGVKKAFGPAINAVLGGLNRALRIFVGVLSDRKIVGALRSIGRALGTVLVGLAKAFSSKQFRDSFVTLARGGAQLVKILGNRVFKDLVVIFTRIAVAALPLMLQLFRDLAGVLDRWAAWIAKNPKELKQHIEDLVGSFRGWLQTIIDVSGFLLRLGGTLKSLGDTIGSTFRGIKDSVGSFFSGSSTSADKFSTALNLTGRDAENLRTTISGLGKVLSAVVESVVPAFTAALDTLRLAIKGFVQIVAGIIAGDWKGAWNGVLTIARAVLKGVIALLQTFAAPFRLAGRLLGKGFASAFEKAARTIKRVATSIINGVISLINKAIDAINAVTPGDIKVRGHTIVPGIDDIGHVSPIGKKRKPNLNPGHLPVLTKHPQARPVAAPKVSPLGTSHDSAAFRQVFEQVDINVTTPSGAVPDGRFMAIQAARELARRQ